MYDEQATPAFPQGECFHVEKLNWLWYISRALYATIFWFVEMLRHAYPISPFSPQALLEDMLAGTFSLLLRFCGYYAKF